MPGRAMNANDIALAGGAKQVDLVALAARATALEYAQAGGLSITALTATPSVIELGVPNDVVLNWTLNRNPTDQNVNGFQVPSPATARTLTYQNVTGAANYLLTAQDANAPGGAAQATRSVSVAALLRRFWGVSTAAALDGPGVIALGAGELASARAKSVTLDGGASPGKYGYIAYPAAWGDPLTTRVFGFDEDFVKTTVSVARPSGNVSYTVLRTPNTLVGSGSVEIT